MKPPAVIPKEPLAELLASSRRYSYFNLTPIDRLTWWDAILLPVITMTILGSGIIVGWLARSDAPHEMRWWVVGVYRQLAALATQLGS